MGWDVAYPVVGTVEVCRVWYTLPKGRERVQFAFQTQLLVVQGSTREEPTVWDRREMVGWVRVMLVGEKVVGCGCDVR